MNEPPDSVLEAFRIAGATTRRVGSGHIHLTFVVGSAGRPAAIVQRLNQSVFGDLGQLVANAKRTTAVLRRAGLSTLVHLSGPEEGGLVSDAEGHWWRAYEYVDGAAQPAPLETAAIVELTRHYGRFAAAFTGSDPSEWHAVIPGFHDHDLRAREFRTAAIADSANRAENAQRDILRAEGLIDKLEGLEEFAAWAEAPLRIVHHDAKPENVVFSPKTLTSTVIDLDTVMAGTILSDIGELTRSCARTAPEDEPGGRFDIGRARAAVSGFLAGWAEPLHPAESAALPIAGLLLTVQNSMRFLGDHLAGDVYFAVADPDHNLSRFRSMAAQAEDNFMSLDRLRRELRPSRR